MSNLALGIDLGGTNLRHAVIDESGHILRRDVTARPRGKEIETLQQIIDSEVTEEVCGVGISVPGFVTREEAVTSKNLNWIGLKPREILKSPVPIILENDLNAAAYGEAQHGAAKGIMDAVVVTISTGIGGGIIQGGQVHRGAHGIAGEVGHMVVVLNGLLCGCGRRGCWEMLASGTAHERRIQQAFQSGTWTHRDSAPTASEVTEMAKNGDKAALALLKQTARYIALGLANLVNIHNPEMIVLFGGFAINTWPLVKEDIQREVDQQALVAGTRITVAQLGDDSGLIGAASLVFSRI